MSGSVDPATGEADRARALSSRIEAGAMFVDGIVASDPRVPFGGFTQIREHARGTINATTGGIRITNQAHQPLILNGSV